MFTRWSIALLFSVSISNVGNAAIIVDFNFSGGNGNPNSVDPNATSTPFTAGAGLNSETFAGLNATSRDWNVASSAAAQAGNRFWEFTVSADAGYFLDFDNITFNEFGGTSGPTNFEVLLNGTSLGSFSSSTTNVLRDINLSAQAPLTNATFRFVAWNAPNNGTNATWTIDNVQLNGAAVPEPSALLMAGIALIPAIYLVQRKRRQHRVTLRAAAC